MFSVVEREYSSTMTAPVRSQLDAGRFEAESRGVCVPARRIHDGVDDDRGGCPGRDQAGLERPVRAPLDAGDIAAEPDVDALAEQLLMQVLAHVQVEAAEDLLAAVREDHLRADAVEDSGEFRRDVPAPDHEHASRQLRQLQGLVRGDAVLDSRDRGQRGPAAGGDQDVLAV